MNVVAPHLVHQIPFLFPLYEGGPYRPFVVQTGIALYSTLARAKLNGLVEPSRARRMVPDLRVERPPEMRPLRRLLDERQPADAGERPGDRRGGRRRSSTTRRSPQLRARAGPGRRCGGRGRRRDDRRSRARVVVNASGPWLDDVRRLEDPAAGRSIRLSKGVHVLVDPERPWSAALTVPHDKVRVSFAVPWQGMLLLGTTDTLYEGEPGPSRGRGGRHRAGARRGGGRGRAGADRP